VGGDVRARYDELIRAWAEHDLVRIQQMHARDVTLEIDGRHHFAGKYTGVGAVLAALVKFVPYVQAAEPEPDSVEVEGDRLEATSKLTVRSMGGAEQKTLFRTTFRFGEDGLIVHVHNRADDQDALDAFFGMIDAERGHAG
jgi:hypothetical protein